MYRFVNSVAILLATARLLPGMIVAQETSPLHLFTGKNGKTLSAVLLKILPEKNRMLIRRDDGQEFETEIILFSLDDQQYVKDWSKNQASNPEPQSDFRLDVSVTRLPGGTFKDAKGSFSREEKEAIFKIEVQNLSRETLESARIQYAVVWDDGAIVHQTDRGNWSFPTLGTDSPTRVQKGGEIDLQALRFNGETSVETPPIRLDQVFWNDGDLLCEDTFIGIKVCVRAQDGSIIQEADLGSASIGLMTWDDVGVLPEPTIPN